MKALKAVLGVVAVAGILAGVFATTGCSMFDRTTNPTVVTVNQNNGGPSPSPSASPGLCGLTVTRVEINGPNTVKAGQSIALGLTASSPSGALPPACADSLVPSWAITNGSSACALVGNQQAYGNQVSGLAAGSCSIEATVSGVTSGAFVVTVTP